MTTLSGSQPSIVLYIRVYSHHPVSAELHWDCVDLVHRYTSVHECLNPMVCIHGHPCGMQMSVITHYKNSVSKLMSSISISQSPQQEDTSAYKLINGQHQGHHWESFHHVLIVRHDAYASLLYFVQQVQQCLTHVPLFFLLETS